MAMAIAMTEVFEIAHPPGRWTAISSSRRDQNKSPSVHLSNWRWEQIERPKRGGVLSLWWWTRPTFPSWLLLSVLDTKYYKYVQPM